MNLEALKPLLSEIVALSESVPDKYREATYVTLLQHALESHNESTGRTAAAVAESGQQDFVANGAVRSFFSRTGLTEEELRGFVIQSDGAIHFVKEPTIVPKARATVEWAILLALANGLTRGEFSVTRREIRRKADEVGCYDSKNFTSTLRESEKYFNGAFVDEDAKRFLAPAGEAQLAQIVRRLS
jgi:hypothetical protein